MSKKQKLTRDPVQIRKLKASMDSFVEQFPDHVELFETLLSQGGHAVAPQVEQDLTKVIDRGYLQDGRGAELMRGQPISCHSNAALLWAENRDHSVIMTGWALSDDGVWRQHSWVKHLGTGKIYETTNPRVLYYGFDLMQDEAELFYDENVR